MNTAVNFYPQPYTVTTTVSRVVEHQLDTQLVCPVPNPDGVLVVRRDRGSLQDTLCLMQIGVLPFSAA